VGAASVEAAKQLWNKLNGHVPTAAPPPAAQDASLVEATSTSVDDAPVISETEADVILATPIWPLEDETPGALDPATNVRISNLRVSAPLQLLQRKGDFVRAVCVNALNHRQLAVSLSKGVHQLEITDNLPSMQPDTPAGGEIVAQGQWTAWGLGVKNAAHGETNAEPSASISGEQAEIRVLQSQGSEMTARCLCSHPKLPLYLAGGDSVVQCWQFGQTIQGRGLHDHLRSQYKLPSNDRVTSLRISPCCEQFACIDATGHLCLWRFGGFPSGIDSPPFCRLQCHARRGSDLCFVGSSALLATVGQSSQNSASLGLWDILLPPSQAQVASCNAHQDGGSCIAYSAATQAVISGGERGDISVFDLRQRRQRQQWSAHSLAVRCLAIHEPTSLCFSASADGDLKLWRTDQCPEASEDPPSSCGHWVHAHEPHTMLHPLPGTALGRTYGINQVALDGADRLLSAGADGRVKLWAVQSA